MNLVTFGFAMTCVSFCVTFLKFEIFNELFFAIFIPNNMYLVYSKYFKLGKS